MAGISVIVVVVVAFLHILAFVLAIGAEMRRSTGKVVPDEYDERTFCAYDSDASTAYGLSAFGLLLLSQAVVSAATRCLCFGRGLSAGGPRTCAIASFVVSWISFLVAEVCLLAGSARNAYHTKYVGYFAKKDLSSCTALRKGVFAAGATFVLLSMISSLLYYWSYSKADMGGWVKHQNEGGVGMAEFGPEKRGLGNTNG
ncbi:uncharacterized protein LOC135598769 [Musa acuminata AAA Group]|uniref:(wild Malaysian banana) hypothetical protein n=1 Tax=Musa acuminata subsp. malaccensis TaxID=214687 RepID=A0A804HU40_MUSAM|nr:PREDICTED: uncharacterized protein LOC103991878 [Musa acuminata subsp. malaccensis]XP_009409703.1 PREDICTED: uncharacterized protein LOC103991878 [Musa acuminata subsp. malaccensis]CAG1859531.1 unnamed protein product [Musa acuminata subsp. malaccensis]